MTKKTFITAALLAALVLLQYTVTISFGFVPYDDTIHITENRLFAVQEAVDWQRAWLAPIQKLYIPLTYTVWAGIAWLARQSVSGDGFWLYEPMWFHIANVMLHLWNTLWVAAILRCWLQREFAIIVAAALFALHPLQIEAVAWASGMRDLLAAGLALPALWCVLLALRQQRSLRGLVVGATVLYILSLLAKPAAVALPFMIVVVLLFARRWSWRWCLLVFGWIALALPIVLITKMAQTTGDFVTYPWWQRPWVAADAISFYLAKILLPWRLSIDYGSTPAVVIQRVSSWFAMGIVCLLILVVSQRWNRPWAMGLVCFVAALLPVLGIVPFEFQFHSTVADRYVYLGMLGIAVIVGSVVAKPRKSIDGIAIVLLAVAMVLARPRVQLWGNPQYLFEQALITNPGSLIAWQAIGAEQMAGRNWENAIRAYRSVLSLRPDFIEAEYNLGVAFEHLGRDEQALEYFSKIARSSQASYSSLTGVARCAKRLRRWDLAIDALQHAERAFPGRLETLWIWAEVLIGLRDFDRADEKFRLALKKRPGAYDLRTVYADFLAERGDQSAAIAQYRLALDGEPRAVAARVNLGGVLAGLGRYEEAERELRESIRLAPELATARVNLAILLENTGRGSAAASEFEAALRLEPNREDARLGLERLARRAGIQAISP